VTYNPHPFPSAPLNPPAPPKSRKRLWIILGIIGGLLLVGCCGGGFAGYAYLTDGYPAALRTPGTVAGMDYQATSTEINRDAEVLAFNNLTGDWDSTLFAAYRQVVTGNAQITLVGGTRFIMFPKALLDTYVTPDHVIDTGDAGGYMQCANMVVQSTERVTRCGWATHGALVLVTFIRIENKDARKMMPAIRAAIETTS